MTENEKQPIKDTKDTEAKYKFTNVIAETLPEWSLEPPQVFIPKKKLDQQSGGK